MVDPSGGPFIATRKYDGIVSATNMGNFHTSWEGLLVKDIERIGPIWMQNTSSQYTETIPVRI